MGFSNTQQCMWVFLPCFMRPQCGKFVLFSYSVHHYTVRRLDTFLIVYIDKLIKLINLPLKIQLNTKCYMTVIQSTITYMAEAETSLQLIHQIK